MKVRICPKCHIQNEDIAWTCSNCGATLSLNTIVNLSEIQGEEKVVGDEMDTAVSPNPDEDIERNSLALIAGALAGFITPIIVSILFAIYFIVDNFLYYFNHPNLTWTNYRYYLDDLIRPIGSGILLGIIYGVGLALMALILTNKKLNTPKDWAKASGTITFVVLLIPTILASPILLFGIAHMLVEGSEESVWVLFYLYTGLLGLGIVSGYVAGLIFRRLCRRRNL